MYATISINHDVSHAKVVRDKIYNFLELYAHWKGDSRVSGNCQTGKGGADLKIIIYTQHSYGGGGGGNGPSASATGKVWLIYFHIHSIYYRLKTTLEVEKSALET